MTLIAVVIPTYKAKSSILDVLARMPASVSSVYVVDDCCPQKTGRFVEDSCNDPRVRVLYHSENSGVGGATKTGYIKALSEGADVIVKIDSDGQMAPEIIEEIAGPVIRGDADYSKGNRFWNVSDVRGMPAIRIVGNAGVSLLSKLSTGLWHIFDPANGYTAISGNALASLPLDKISDRYFFESDMLFRLALDHRRVADVPMKAVYGDEVSGLNIRHTLMTFLPRYFSNFGKRIVIEYVIRDFNIASLALIAAAITLPIGILHGTWGLVSGWFSGQPSTASSVVFTALLLIVGYVSLMNFFSYDYAASRRR